MTSHDVLPHEVAEKAIYPGRVRVNSQGSTYVFPSTPSPTRENQNHHPYGIKTTSTGILTRSNSSAGAPYSQHSYSPVPSPSSPHRLARSNTTTHRYTKSLTSRDEAFPIPIPTPPSLPSPPPRTWSRSSSMSRSGDEESEVELASSDSEYFFASRTRHSETLPSLFTPKQAPVVVASDNYSETAKTLGLPQNPKYWSPTNLSLYLGTVLSTGRDGPLQDHVLRHVQIHVIHEKISGRQFMRLAEADMEDWGINSFAKVQLVVQAQELRQRAVKGRIYGFKGPSMSPSKMSKHSGGILNSLESSPQSDDTYQDESDAEEPMKNGGAGRIGRALPPNKSPRGSAASSSHFTTPSRLSLGRLADDESRGRVKGMIESYEESSGHRSRGGSVSDFLSAGDEEKRVDADTAHVPFPKADERDPEARELDPDVTITSPANYFKDFPPLPESPDGLFYAGQPENDEYSPANNLDFAAQYKGPPLDSVNVPDSLTDNPFYNVHPTSPAIPKEEPSVRDLLKDAEADDYISSHPWEDEVMGETARRVSAVHASARKSSLAARRFRTSGSLGKNDEGTRAHLLALFTPLPEGDHSLELGDELVTAATSTDHLTAPPSYTDQNVETDFGDLKDRLYPQDHVGSDTEMVGLLEVFRNRLAEVERKLDEMEHREAQRVLKEQEAACRCEIEEDASPKAALQPALGPPTNAVERENTSVGVTSGPSKRSVVNRKSPKTKTRPVPKQSPYPEYLSEGIPQFIFGASFGIIVIVMQTLLKRYTGKRP